MENVFIYLQFKNRLPTEFDTFYYIALTVSQIQETVKTIPPAFIK